MRWFAARTFYRIAPVGRPRRADRYYSPAIAAIEERIVVFRAESGTAALRRAKVEGRKYASTASCLNRYGQHVVTKLLRGTDAYELDERPRDATETFSAIQIVSTRDSAAAILAHRLGHTADGRTAHMFIAGEIAAELEKRSTNWPVKAASKPLEWTGIKRRGKSNRRRIARSAPSR
jgi:hypothetical protein